MRYYAPWLARFISVDPLQFKYPIYTPYQYAGNKPISYIDLDGAEEMKPVSNPIDEVVVTADRIEAENLKGRRASEISPLRNAQPSNNGFIEFYNTTAVNEYSFDEYVSKLEKTYGELTEGQIEVLKTGCIGITCFHLNTRKDPPFEKGYSTFELAKTKADELKQDIMSNPDKYPPNAHVVIFAKRFWSNDPKKYLPNSEGEIDLTGYDSRVDVRYRGSRFDYGYYDESTNLWTDANHYHNYRGQGMTIYEKTLTYFSAPLPDYNRLVFGVAVSTLTPNVQSPLKRIRKKRLTQTAKPLNNSN